MSRQHVANTDAAKAAYRETANDHSNAARSADEVDEGDTSGKASENEQVGNVSVKRERPDDEEAANVDERSTVTDELESSSDEEDDSHPKKKRVRGNNSEQRQVGKRSVHKEGTSKGAEQYGDPSGIDRLPEEGQKVHWRAASGWCEGTVLEILYEEKEVAGRKAKASQNDPRIVLKSAKSGKSAVHKPGAVYF